MILQTDNPSSGIIIDVLLTNPITIPAQNGLPARQAVSSPKNVVYIVEYYTTNGPKRISGAPSQIRWDCVFYPAIKGCVVDLHYITDKVFFTVTELPVSEICSTN